jgi:hypothetical protein
MEELCHQWYCSTESNCGSKGKVPFEGGPLQRKAVAGAAKNGVAATGGLIQFNQTLFTVVKTSANSATSQPIPDDWGRSKICRDHLKTWFARAETGGQTMAFHRLATTPGANS